MPDATEEAKSPQVRGRPRVWGMRMPTPRQGTRMLHTTPDGPTDHTTTPGPPTRALRGAITEIRTADTP
ncbi:Uncharacterised protein [Mycobacteroides abscessus subsp. abscessus]|nr:Uncharacterised protein [Mycobacteroides abscessus subsp. abscessus]